MCFKHIFFKSLDISKCILKYALILFHNTFLLTYIGTNQTPAQNYYLKICIKHAFIQQIFIEGPLCARLCVRKQHYSYSFRAMFSPLSEPIRPNPLIVQ